MRGWIVVLALMLLPACGASLHTHSNVAAVARDLIDASGEAIQREWDSDLAEIHKSGENVSAREKTLVETFAPIQLAYDGAVAALEEYKQAISESSAQNAMTLETTKTRALVGAWRALADVGDAIGVKIPQPPAMLTELADP